MVPNELEGVEVGKSWEFSCWSVMMCHPSRATVVVLYVLNEYK